MEMEWWKHAQDKEKINEENGKNYKLKNKIKRQPKYYQDKKKRGKRPTLNFGAHGKKYFFSNAFSSLFFLLKCDRM